MNNEKDIRLSTSETLIMKAIWDYGGDVPLNDFLEYLQIKYHKDYSRTTVATFILRLSEKGFVSTYRKGKYSYIHPLKDEMKFKESLIKEETKFWFGDNILNVFSALCGAKKISKNEADQMRKMLDELEE